MTVKPNPSAGMEKSVHVHLLLKSKEVDGFMYCFCVCVTRFICLSLFVELARELLKTKRVQIATEEVILEDESKPKKKKKGGGK